MHGVPHARGAVVHKQGGDAVLEKLRARERVDVVPKVLARAVARDLGGLHALDGHVEQLGVAGLDPPRLAPCDPALGARAVSVAVRAARLEVRQRLGHHALALFAGQQIGDQEDPRLLVDRAQAGEVDVDGEVVPVRRILGQRDARVLREHRLFGRRSVCARGWPLGAFAGLSRRFGRPFLP